MVVSKLKVQGNRDDFTSASRNDKETAARMVLPPVHFVIGVVAKFLRVPSQDQQVLINPRLTLATRKDKPFG